MATAINIFLNRIHVQGLRLFVVVHGRLRFGSGLLNRLKDYTYLSSFLILALLRRPDCCNTDSSSRSSATAPEWCNCDICPAVPVFREDPAVRDFQSLPRRPAVPRDPADPSDQWVPGDRTGPADRVRHVRLVRLALLPVRAVPADPRVQSNPAVLADPDSPCRLEDRSDLFRPEVRALPVRPIVTNK